MAKLIVDEHTGEYEDYQPKNKLSNMEFALFFAKNLCTLGKAEYSIKDKIIAKIISKMGGDNIVYIQRPFKEPLVKHLGCHISYIMQVVNELIKDGVLRRVGKGAYMVNPYIFGKGNIQNVAKVRIQFDAMFSKDGIELTHKVEKTK